jgi:hypothetical protein
MPPRSVVRLVRSDDSTPCWKGREGTISRIGYYSRQDGLGVIWLVNDEGEYCETVDRRGVLKYFQVLEVSDETDLYGDNREPLGPRLK